MQKIYFEFKGNGREYFKIWIVNLLLTIITLGIYSAWAKVRRNQYFYRNTYLAGSSFDYHASPVAILKGRLVALVLFTTYSQSIKFSFTLYLVTLVVIMAILPWLMQRSLCFRLNSSSYRGLRFHFAGSVGGAYRVFLLWPILTLFTLYMLMPFAHHRMKKYQHNNSWFGQTPFSFYANTGDFYLIYLITFTSIIGLGLLTGIGITVLGLASLSVFTGDARRVLIFAAFIYGFIILFALFIGPYFSSRIQNLIWSNTKLGDYQFNSHLQARKLLFIFVTNILGIIFTLGLFKPFASVRLLKYRLDSLNLQIEGDLQTFVSNQESEVSAVGEGAADIFDIDISL